MAGIARARRMSEPGKYRQAGIRMRFAYPGCAALASAVSPGAVPESFHGPGALPVQRVGEAVACALHIPRTLAGDQVAVVMRSDVNPLLGLGNH